MELRRSTIYLGTIAILVLSLAGLILHATGKVRASAPHFARKAALVRQLELTDLCLFTEANYTRHPSMADLATPFQDGPMSMEHFPSGALLGPPPHLVRHHDRQD
jgi:hypothetical protein